jgi:hypothetical protein
MGERQMWRLSGYGEKSRVEVMDYLSRLRRRASSDEPPRRENRTERKMPIMTCQSCSQGWYLTDEA